MPLSFTSPSTSATTRKLVGGSLRRWMHLPGRTSSLAEVSVAIPSSRLGGAALKALFGYELEGFIDPTLLQPGVNTFHQLQARSPDGSFGLKQSVSQVLRNTRDRLNSPMLLVTHDLDVCFELAEYVCLVEKGRCLQAGPAEQVLIKPASADAARLLGIFSLVPGEIRALDPARNTSRIVIVEQEIEAQYLPGHLLGDRGLVCLREPDLEVSAIREKIVPGKVVLAIVAAATCPQGMRLQLQGGISVTVAEALYERELRGQGHVQLRIPASAVSFVAGPYSH